MKNMEIDENFLREVGLSAMPEGVCWCSLRKTNVSTNGKTTVWWPLSLQ